jgi:hypothetical protein
MARISRAHRKRIALVTCLVGSLAASFGAPAANADVLDAVTGQVEAVVSPVEQQVVPPVQQVGETLTAPTKAAPAGNPPAVQVPDVVSAPPVAKLDDLPGQATGAVTGTAAAAGAAARSAPDAVATAKEDAEAATEATSPPPLPSTLPDPASPSASAPETTVSKDPDTSPTYALSSSPSSPSSQANAYVPPPANDGSTGAPLPRWVAYVWPAVALTGSDLANFAVRWSQASTDLATGEAAGSGAAEGVAGVHASGGRPGDGGSSSLFAKIPSAGAHAFTSVPTSVWLYLGLLVLAVIAVALAVRREVAAGRRQY